jgi:hypothetical protein
MAHGFGNSHSRARPDEKMGRNAKRQSLWTSAQRQVEKHQANRKRRQRDR